MTYPTLHDVPFRSTVGIWLQQGPVCRGPSKGAERGPVFRATKYSVLWGCFASASISVAHPSHPTVLSPLYNGGQYSDISHALSPSSWGLQSHGFCTSRHLNAQVTQFARPTITSAWEDLISPRSRTRRAT